MTSNTLYTSLDEIESFNPCASGWRDILKGQGKTESDSVQFPLVDCVKSNSISDVCWLLGKRRKEIQICVKFAKLCADSVAHLRNKCSLCADADADAAAAAAGADAAAIYAAEAANYAAEAAYYAAYYDAYDAAAAADAQKKKNRQFLIQCINEWKE